MLQERASYVLGRWSELFEQAFWKIRITSFCFDSHHFDTRKQYKRHLQSLSSTVSFQNNTNIAFNETTNNQVTGDMLFVSQVCERNAELL